MRILFLLLIIPFNFACSQQKDPKVLAAEIFTNIRDYKFAKVIELFDSNLARRIDTVKLKRNWEGVLTLAGPYIKTIDVSTERNDSTSIVIQYCQFEKRKMNN